MSWGQVVAILLTGLLAVTASGVGQYVGGRMADKRAQEERARLDRDRFAEAKRQLYVDALHMISNPIDITIDLRNVPMASALGLFDQNVERAFQEVWAQTVVLHVQYLRGTPWEQEPIDEYRARVERLKRRMATSLGTD